MCAASWASTARCPSASSSVTSCELSTTIGFPTPNVIAFANGNCVRYRSGTAARSKELTTWRWSTQMCGSCSWPSRTDEPSETARSARSYPSSISLRTTWSR